MIVELIGDSPKDIDLRVGMPPSIAANQSTIVNDTKKRVSEEMDLNEPKSKKTKSEKIDM